MPAGRAGGHKWVARRPLHCFAFASRPCTRERRKSGCPVSVPRWRRDGAVPEGITPTAAPPAALAPRKRGREPPSRPARVRQLEGQAPCGALATAANAATYSMMSPTTGRVRKRTPNTPLRRRCAPGATSGAGNLTRLLVARQGGLIDRPMVRGRGVSAAAHRQYIRAGKVCERATGTPGTRPFTTLTLPPPLLSVRPGVRV